MLNKKAFANLNVAKECCLKSDIEYYSVGASRAYYSIFQATKAFLINNEFDYNKFLKVFDPSKKEKLYSHGTISGALKNYLQANSKITKEDPKFIPEIVNTFNKLYSWRIKADYEISIISEEELKDAILKADKLINKLIKIKV